MSISALVGSQLWGEFATAVALKGAAILVLALVATRLLRRQPAAVRHGVWLVAILAQLATPVLGSMLPAWWPAIPTWSLTVDLAQPANASPAASPAASPTQPDAARDVAPMVGAAASAAPNAAVAPPFPAQPTDDAAPTDWRLVAVGVWATGAALVLLWLVAGSFGVALIARRAERVTDGEWLTLATRLSAEMGLGRPVVLLRGRGLAVPVTWGVLVPVVLLPTGADEWSAETRRTVLLHELAHVRRFDMLSQLAAHVVLALCWFDPLVWVGVRAMRAESERACDDTVLRHGTEPSAYVHDLLSIVRSARPTRVPALAALAMARPTEFEGRVLAILDASTSRGRAGRAAKLATVVAALVVVAPLAAMRPSAPRVGETTTVTSESPTADGATAPDDRSPSPSSGQRQPPQPRWATPRPDVGAVIDGAAASIASEVAASVSSNVSTQLSNASSLLSSAMRWATQPPVGMPTPTPMPTPSPAPNVSNAWSRQFSHEVKVPRVRVKVWDREGASAGARESVVPLIGALSDSDTEVRRSAAHALGGIEDPRAVDALMQALQRDADAGVRETAAWALGQLEDRRAVAVLGEALRSDQSAGVRKQSAWALGQIEDRAAVDALGAALRDGDAAVRRTAAWALGQIQDPRSVPFLVPALTNADAETRKQAAWALGQIESRDAVAALAGALRDASVSVKETAAWALGQIEDASAVAALTVSLKDAAPGVRKQSAWALGQIEAPAAVPALVAALEDGDRGVRQMAVWALGEIEDPSAAAGLAALTRSTDLETRRAAVHALARIGGVASVEALVALLKDPDPEVRRAAVQALARR